MTKYPYTMKCTKCGKDFVYKSEHAMLEQSSYNKLVATAVCPKCKKRSKEYRHRIPCPICGRIFIYHIDDETAERYRHEPCEICQKKTEERLKANPLILKDKSGEVIKLKVDNLILGERLYCLEQDIEEYIQHNGLEADKELDFILKQVIEIKEIIQKEM